MNPWTVLSADLRDSVQNPVFYPKSERENTTRSQALNAKRNLKRQENVLTDNYFYYIVFTKLIAYSNEKSVLIGFTNLPIISYDELDEIRLII